MALDRMIANFMTASTPIESYLQKDLPMTAMQWDLVAPDYLQLANLR